MVPSPITPIQATPIQLRGSNDSLHSALFPISNRFTAGRARASTANSPVSYTHLDVYKRQVPQSIVSDEAFHGADGQRLIHLGAPAMILKIGRASCRERV